VNKKASGRVLDGRTWGEVPEGMNRQGAKSAEDAKRGKG
jgi:hypothetical protein